MGKKYLFLLLLGSGGLVQAQKLKKDDRLTLANLRQHVQYLADDKLEGRRTGTPGEAQAAAYIREAFEKAGLQPQGSNGFLQPFEIGEGRQIDEATELLINGKKLALEQDYFPLVFSANATLRAEPSLALQEPGMPWFYDLKGLLEEAAGNPHFDLQDAIRTRARDLKEKGATALFIYNTSTKADGLKFNGKDRSEAVELPVIYLQSAPVKQYLSDADASLAVQLTTRITEKKRSGTNVVGYIDNGAPTTVVLGAHFDHLGRGEDGNTREVEKLQQVHNGADDNASGTAALLELARLLKAAKAPKSNYLFIAFSGEELGLYGSKYFTQNPTIDLATVNYMINMDMIGRLNDSSRTVTLGGFGTSPSWAAYYGVKGKKGLYGPGLQFRYDSSGTGPSDHTSFYLKNIPVLFYFTGLHSDYHKPTDDFDKINYLGELELVKHIYSLVQASEKTGERLAFTKTREAQTTTSARFSVSLGIMPDYTFSGSGVRVDGVSENRPAQKAGLKAGDVITALGPVNISSMESYMQALSTFKKGDKTTVQFLRDRQPLSATVEF